MRQLIEPSHLDLCCLQKPIIIACGSERVKTFKQHLLWTASPILLDLHMQHAWEKSFRIWEKPWVTMTIHCKTYNHILENYNAYWVQVEDESFGHELLIFWKSLGAGIKEGQHNHI